MPSIFGIAGGDCVGQIGATLRTMADCLRCHSSEILDLHEDAASAFGFGRLQFDFQHKAKAVNCVGHDLVALVDGEISNLDQQSQCSIADGQTEDVFAARYLADGNGFLRSLNGKFAAAFWDSKREILRLVSDRFGMRPLYIAHVSGRLVFASQIKALLTDCRVSRQKNLRGIAQFFTFGQLLGEDTFLQDVHLLPAASCLTYDVRQDRVSVERYWQLSISSDGNVSNTAALERIDNAFGNAVTRCTTGVANLGLSLSGGLDARSILAAMDDSQPIKTVSIGVEGSADHSSAAEMARLTGRQHHQYFLGDDFLERFEEHLRHMVRLTDGHYLSQCIVMPTLPVYRELGIEVLLRGHAGELMHMRKAYNFSLDAKAMSLRDEDSLEDWLFRHLQAYMLDGTDGRLFAQPHRDQIEGLARESLRSCLKESEGLNPPLHRIWHMFLSQRSRRETAMSLVKFGSFVETRLPYLDNDLIDALFAAPPELKLDETIQAYILRRRRPAFLKVMNVNTGTSVDAGQIGHFIGKIRQKVLAKLGVRGYQPYERLGLWLRRELRPLVDRILLSEQCLGRGIFDPQTVRKVVEGHWSGQNFTFLILALMIFEVGQQEFLDDGGKAGKLFQESCL